MIRWFWWFSLNWIVMVLVLLLLCSQCFSVCRCSPALLPAQSSTPSRRRWRCRTTASGFCAFRIPTPPSAGPASPPKRTSRWVTTSCCEASCGPARPTRRSDPQWPAALSTRPTRRQNPVWDFKMHTGVYGFISEEWKHHHLRANASYHDQMAFSASLYAAVISKAKLMSSENQSLIVEVFDCL